MKATGSCRAIGSAGLVLVLAAAILVGSPGLSGAFGTGETALTVGGLGFGPRNSNSFDGGGGNWHDTSPSGSRSCAVNSIFIFGRCELVAPVHFPSGALVDRFEAEVCDFNPAGGIFPQDVTVDLQRSNGDGDVTTLASASTSGAPGCVTITGLLATPETIENGASIYFLRYLGDHSTIPPPPPAPQSGTRIHAVRIFYTLQITPAPAIATFNDVPTSHIFFRFIEALVDAGVTAGCGGGNYCPDDPVTRGQMAVFISRALGLNWTP